MPQSCKAMEQKNVSVGRWRVIFKLKIIFNLRYHTTNVARCWTYLTNILVGGPELDRSIPEHEYYEEYGSDFVLPIRAGNRANKNTKEDLQKLVDSAFDLINLIKE